MSQSAALAGSQRIAPVNKAQALPTDTRSAANSRSAQPSIETMMFPPARRSSASNAAKVNTCCSLVNCGGRLLQSALSRRHGPRQDPAAPRAGGLSVSRRWDCRLPAAISTMTSIECRHRIATGARVQHMQTAGPCGFGATDAPASATTRLRRGSLSARYMNSNICDAPAAAEDLRNGSCGEVCRVQTRQPAVSTITSKAASTSRSCVSNCPAWKRIATRPSRRVCVR